MTVSKPKQQGAILFITLIILMMMTVVAITSTRISTSGQRISFNHQMKNTSFQTAEKGLLAAKNQLVNTPNQENFTNTSPFTDPQTGQNIVTEMTVTKAEIMTGNSLSVSAPRMNAYKIVSTSTITSMNIVTELEEGYLKPEVADQ